jgi:uncharacterized membrane protein
MIHSTTHKSANRTKRTVFFVSRYWLTFFGIIFSIFVSLPFLAPVLMKFNLENPARIIYSIYSFLCHQLPQRSFFLFGKQFTYSLTEIKSVWLDTNNPLVLRHFIGTPGMGWKVALSDRMVSMYTGALFFIWFWYLVKNLIRPLSWQGLSLLSFPMALDGFTHMFSDFAGLGLGFRDSHRWLATITNNAFSSAFYAGDGWGSFNSIMRLITGFLFGVGIVWFVTPHINELFKEMETRYLQKSQQ